MVFDTVARYYQEFQAEDGMNAALPHVVISNLEHDSVDITARKMEEQGKIGKYYDVAWTDVYFVLRCLLQDLTSSKILSLSWY